MDSRNITDTGIVGVQGERYLHCICTEVCIYIYIHIYIRIGIYRDKGLYRDVGLRGIYTMVNPTERGISLHPYISLYNL